MLLEVLENDDRPLAMVCFASRQIWPNLLGLLHYRGQVRRLFVYASDNERESLEPARRFEAMARHFLGDCPIHPVEPLPIEAHEVAAVLARWREEFPGHRWLLQTTGGLKLMTLGAASFAEDPDVTMIYRELDSGWRRFWKTPEGPFVSERLALDDAAPISSVRPTDFARLQFGPIDAEAWKSEPAKPHDLSEIVDRAIACHWDYAATMKAPNSGKGFECFVGACVLALGAARAELNVRRGRGDEFEIDVLATTPDRIVLVDCKLDRTKSLAQAIDTNRNRANALGGLNAGVAMLWPNHGATDANRLYAAQHRVTLITRDEAPEMLSMLGRVLTSQPLSPEAKAVEARLVARSEDGYPVVGDAHREVALATDEESGLLSLENLRKACAKTAGAVRWYGIEGDGCREVWVECPGRVEAVVAALASLGCTGVPKEREKTVSARFRATDLKGAQFAAKIKACLGEIA